MIAINAYPRHITPFVSSGLFFMNDAAISVITVRSRNTVGPRSSTSFLESESTGSLSFLNKYIITGIVASAPSSTAKKMLGLPCRKKKLIKSIFA